MTTIAIRYLLPPSSPTLPSQTVQSTPEDPPPYCRNSARQQRFVSPERKRERRRRKGGGEEEEEEGRRRRKRRRRKGVQSNKSCGIKLHPMVKTSSQNALIELSPFHLHTKKHCNNPFYFIHTHYKNENSIKGLLILKFFETGHGNKSGPRPQYIPLDMTLVDPPPNIDREFKSYHMNLQLVE